MSVIHWKCFVGWTEGQIRPLLTTWVHLQQVNTLKKSLKSGMKPGLSEFKLFLVDLDMKWDHVLTSPSFSDALAFHSRMFISSEALRTYLLSADHLTQMTCCIRLVWYTSLRIVGNHIESQKIKSRCLRIVAMKRKRSLDPSITAR